ncbi:MAG TPA: hypothetical protein VLB51_11650 [Methylomirabilota bacterium]|nr:hypothetical protein [Methylomirabilota bacterium]
MEIPSRIRPRRRWIGVAVIVVATSAAAEGPPPAPTPKPGTLAAFASRAELDRSRAAADGAIVITDDTLTELGEGAVVTLAGEPAAPLPELTPGPTADPKARSRWRSAVLAQSRKIAGLQARRDAAELELDRLERGSLDARTLDRIEKAEAKLRQIDAEIARERAVLSRIVRDARKDGAQPGWFR